MLENKEEERRPSLGKIRFDDTLNVAHILTTLGMMFALFNWGSGVNTTIAVNSKEIQTIKEARLQSRAELMMSLAEINQKLDKLSDKISDSK